LLVGLADLMDALVCVLSSEVFVQNRLWIIFAKWRQLLLCFHCSVRS
jgi:hypothetical protein